ncbi:mPR-like GPCR protein [Lasiosphaeria hispida]|uniref:MPR-like GPCR protein n=1 Tax=Lasiosphaeria hispida TaxID=260671 RepID=A0AAJ0MLE4_9PEZI|nr:mPR-like GPCR protein [Lasiosphaeria hispida]
MGANSSRLLSYHDIPKWLGSNDYLLSGYRAPSGSVLASLASTLYFNNETVNIYSHLIGGLVFLLLPIYFNMAFDPPLADSIVVTIYLEGVAICFLLSALYHVLDNHSPGISKLFNHLDHLGIVVLMWGASIAAIRYGFLCNFHLQVVYWTLMSCAAGACAAATFLPQFQARPWRVAAFISLGLTGVVFVTHGLLIFGWEAQSRRMSLSWMAGMALCNLIGAFAFATRVPERWVPYTFDILGCSHQILHIAVMVAACLHFTALIKASTTARNETCAS